MVSLGGIARKLFGSANERRVRSYKSKIAAINALEEATKALSDDALAAKTAEFRQQLADGKSLDDLLIPAFAVAREASRRVLHMRPFDVQLTGAMILHRGAIAEMKTGEGKTLVATLAVYLNALAGKGVHVVTVNDYLAQRDAATMSKLYRFLGLTTGVIVHGLDDDQRREAYGCDITYATNNELGFDYLRDNMKYDRAQMVQRGHNYAIVDEVDSIWSMRRARRLSSPARWTTAPISITPSTPSFRFCRRKITKSMRSSVRPTSPKTAPRSSKTCCGRRACSRADRFTTSKTSPSFTTSTMR